MYIIIYICIYCKSKKQSILVLSIALHCGDCHNPTANRPFGLVVCCCGKCFCLSFQCKREGEVKIESHNQFYSHWYLNSQENPSLAYQDLGISWYFMVFCHRMVNSGSPWRHWTAWSDPAQVSMPSGFSGALGLRWPRCPWHSGWSPEWSPPWRHRSHSLAPWRTDQPEQHRFQASDWDWRPTSLHWAASQRNSSSAWRFRDFWDSKAWDCSPLTGGSALADVGHIAQAQILAKARCSYELWELCLVALECFKTLTTKTHQNGHRFSGWVWSG